LVADLCECLEERVERRLMHDWHLAEDHSVQHIGNSLAAPQRHCSAVILTLYVHIKTAEQRTIIQQHGDWYTCRWWVGCYIWYSEEGPGRAAARPSSPLLAVPNVTTHLSTASVPTSYYSMWHYTVFQKKHVTTFSMISRTRTVCLQRFLAHILLRV